MDDLDLLKRSEARAPHPERAPAINACPSCHYGIRTESPILSGYKQIGSICTCARCGHEWKTWRKDSHRMAHIAACDQPLPKKDHEHG